MRPISTGKNRSHVRLLVVEDDADTAGMLQETLQPWFEVVDVYGNPLQVAEAFKAGTYDLAVIDYGLLPEMNGFDLYAIIKKVDPAIRVCIISGYDIIRSIPESDIHKQFEQLNPPLKHEYILTKPFESKALFSKLWQILDENENGDYDKVKSTTLVEDS